MDRRKAVLTTVLAAAFASVPGVALARNKRAEFFLRPRKGNLDVNKVVESMKTLPGVVRVEASGVAPQSALLAVTFDDLKTSRAALLEKLHALDCEEAPVEDHPRRR